MNAYTYFGTAIGLIIGDTAPPPSRGANPKNQTGNPPAPIKEATTALQPIQQATTALQVNKAAQGTPTVLSTASVRKGAEGSSNASKSGNEIGGLPEIKAQSFNLTINDKRKGRW